MTDWVRDVHEFHRAFCPEQIGQRPKNPGDSVAALRYGLMHEELNEVADAIDAGDLPGLADGLADLIYVAIGTAIAYGIDLRPVWNAVQAANMSKADGGRREDGKVTKPPGWQPPDVAAILARQAPLDRLLGPATETPR